MVSLRNISGLLGVGFADRLINPMKFLASVVSWRIRRCAVERLNHSDKADMKLLFCASL